MTSSRTKSDKSDKPAKRRRTQEERRQETAGKLLDATIDLLLEKGYSRFRIADAAAKAGVSRGGQTHHFATKNDLIEAAIEQLFEGEVSQARSNSANSGDAQIVRQAAQRAGDFLSSKLYEGSLKMLISAGALEHLADGVRAISARSRGPIEDAWISPIVQSGVSRERAEAALGLLWNVQRGLTVERYIGGDAPPMGGEIDLAIELVDEFLRQELGGSPS